MSWTPVFALLVSVIGSAVVGLWVRSLMVERRIASNPDMKPGNKFLSIRAPGGAELLGPCVLKSTEGSRVVFEGMDGGGRLNLANVQFQNLWAIRDMR